MKFSTLFLALLSPLGVLSTDRDWLPPDLRPDDYQEPQELISNHSQTFDAFDDIHHFAKDLQTWSKATSTMNKHFFYDAPTHSILHRSDSDISFSHLLHGKLVLDAFLGVYKQVQILTSKALIPLGYTKKASLSSRELWESKCYCEEFKMGWDYTQEEMIDYFVELGLNQTKSYLKAVDAAEAFLGEMKKFDAAMYRLDEMIALEDGAQNTGPGLLSTGTPTKASRVALKKTKKLRRGMKKFSNFEFPTDRFEDAATVVASRSANLTTMLETMFSFERALASIDLACVMARNGKTTSIEHVVWYGWAKAGMCPVTEDLGYVMMQKLKDQGRVRW